MQSNTLKTAIHNLTSLSAPGRGRYKIITWLIVVAILLLGCLPCSCWGTAPAEPGVQEQPTVLRVAYSPDKAGLFAQLVEGFNLQSLQNFKAGDGTLLKIEPLEMEPEAMIQAALDGEIQALSPDSSIWLDQLDRAWAEKNKDATSPLGEQVRYAVSPVVIAAWEDVALGFGYPEKPVGWEDILRRAQEDKNFRWSHPSTSSASGLLATLAEFYAGAGKTRGLTLEDVQAAPVTEYVGAIEKTVRFYGEGELAVIQRALQEGPAFLDAFIVQEQLVIYFNQQGTSSRLVAIYPREGTLWVDHPLALLDTASLSPVQRQTFRRFREYLLSREAQMLVLKSGYRPADLSIPLDAPESPITPANGVNPREPQTTLQVPGPTVMEAVRDVWWLTKRHTNVYLVVDTSGSMAGDKLAQAQRALLTFIGQIKGDSERVGLIRFSSSAEETMPLAELGGSRERLTGTVNSLQAGGKTALLDAVYLAYKRLQEWNDRERINAIVVMTDGKENYSSMSLDILTARLRQGNAEGVPVVIFCIAYGSDADLQTLEALAQATGGQARYGDTETIQNLYKILSTYF
jgi:Ca-activated chloride channel family protein